MLLLNTQTSVKVNGSISPAFSIIREIRQGYLLAPYLFLIIGEVLNSINKVVIANSMVKSIRLPKSEKQQAIAQFVDNPLCSCWVSREQSLTQNMITLFDKFCFAT